MLAYSSSGVVVVVMGYHYQLSMALISLGGLGEDILLLVVPSTSTDDEENVPCLPAAGMLLVLLFLHLARSLSMTAAAAAECRSAAASPP